MSCILLRSVSDSECSSKSSKKPENRNYSYEKKKALTKMLGTCKYQINVAFSPREDFKQCKIHVKRDIVEIFVLIHVTRDC